MFSAHVCVQKGPRRIWAVFSDLRISNLTPIRKEEDDIQMHHENVVVVGIRFFAVPGQTNKNNELSLLTLLTLKQSTMKGAHKSVRAPFLVCSIAV